MSTDNQINIVEQVEQALKTQQAVSIRGSGSHDFMLADYLENDVVDMTSHRGIIDYQPSELTLKARSGTTLKEIREVLGNEGQRLPTDIPLYEDQATLGGAIAIGHSGSGRPFLGAIRDHILGVGMLNGLGEVLNCGGQVMKNVAGYDISRLLCGSRGTLGPILDITLKVLPKPEHQITLHYELEENTAIETMNRMAGMPLPITACVFLDHRLYVRLEGNEPGLQQAEYKLGGERLDNPDQFWQQVQQQQHPFFIENQQPLWRTIVPTTAPKLELENHHEHMIDWCGGLRWIYSAELTQSDFIHITNVGGYVESFRGQTPTAPSALMTPLQNSFHQKVKTAFDPDNLFNPVLSNFL
ncbi:MAG: glycolate oxidase subunit GlcE [Gammaproteobacteria bacterium]|nr:glycolate oxidase subunit GlcE [Gammaproteobacteria bacterium]